MVGDTSSLSGPRLGEAPILHGEMLGLHGEPLLLREEPPLGERNLPGESLLPGKGFLL